MSGIYIHDEVQRVIDLHADLFDETFRQSSVVKQLDLQAERILEAHANGKSAAATHITCWHPELVGASADTILEQQLSLDDARLTIAREYGFANWSDAESRGSEPPDPNFEAAVDTVLSGDVARLQQLLKETPALVHQRSDFGHRASLLHYCGSNGVETYRQVVPLNLAEVTQTLIDAGADVNASADMYGGNCSALALLITSAFPAEAGVVDDVVQVLLNAGAESDNS